MTTIEKKSIRCDRAIQIFQNRGGDGDYTKAFDTFSEADKGEVLSSVCLSDEETPIIASIRNATSWVLLTCDRLLWKSGGEISELAWESIKDATIPMSSMAALRSKVKTENAVLEVQTDEGTVKILIEPGKPFLGFWNVLKSVPQLS